MWLEIEYAKPKLLSLYSVKTKIMFVYVKNRFNTDLLIDGKRC